ncbi:hypothetical protein AXW38_12100 [Yersinia ruckeri]|uniref:hypothetical protein n=1 Tax=Yersinia TaxID=629 RepID=UPI0004E3A2C6|nr:MULTISPECIES: hypothetical protein [Yersinia]ARZ01781.1 hypothetical protein QMA0440_02459 [Yersinia ruckeri]EKN3342492.1 hypothetical protein [Yersinia enterocolitica]EKN4704211.1 hypothetical protein [Yersinia ruckeri]ELY5242769.1 hypothetical protein [Yersinia enterocolitica]KFE38529.1 putative tail fiber protein [Yersinia ruckeri]
MTHDFSDCAKVSGAEASLQERQIYTVQLGVKSLIDFVVTSFELLGIDKFHELVDPSLGDIEAIIIKLDAKAKQIGDIDLQQILLSAQIMIKNIKEKNPELCEQGSKFLKNAMVFK